MEKKRTWHWKKWILLALPALVLACVLLAKPMYYFYQDVTFYWFERTPTEKLVKAYCEKMHISYGRYPKSLIALLERNPETQDFVLNYPFHRESEYSLADFEDSETAPLFLQWDPRWGYEKYGSDCIGITGCGPTCLAMAGYHLTASEEFTPDRVARFAWKNGYYAEGYGSSWTLISQGGPELGLSVQELPLVKKKLITALEEGKLIILAMGKGDFTDSGHYILLSGLEEEGFRVNDPNSVKNSEKIWTYEQLESQIRNIWAIGAAT